MLLEAGILVAFAVAGLCAWLPSRASRDIIARETGAVRLLRGLQAAQDDHAGRHGRAGFLEALVGENHIGIDLIPDDEDRPAAIARHEGYLVAVFLADLEGRGRGRATDDPIREDFWIAYAWPERFGVTGRRIFVVDSSGSIRYWENSLGTFDGPERIPSAHLAPAPPGVDYPLDRPRLGFLRSVEWTDVDGSR
ncbi:MAG: hypothetical protein R3F20_04165 [Planctomycetota bacterium]